jgi:SAC3 family protein LENG8/THP3
MSSTYQRRTLVWCTEWKTVWLTYPTFDIASTFFVFTSSNQCQTQLKELYKTCPSDTDTSKKDNDTVQSLTADNARSLWKNENEFIAYRLLYYVYLSTNEKYSGGSSDMFHIMLSLVETQRKDPAISHALRVREAVACSDYFLFFRSLRHQCPHLGTFLTDLLVPFMRMRGLRRIAKAYRPSIELLVCLKHLGFVNAGPNENDDNDDNSDGIQHGKEWMIACGAVVSDEGQLFVAKDSLIHEPVATQKNSLI